MIDISNIPEADKVYIAKGVKDQDLLSELARDESYEVQRAVIGNEATGIGILKEIEINSQYRVLSELASDQISKRLKAHRS